jgi:hypothetical protein
MVLKADLDNLLISVPLKYLYLNNSKRVKCTFVQALRLCTGRTAHRGSRGILLPFHDHGTRRGEGSASRPGRSLPPGKTRYPLYRRLGGPQGRTGQVRKISPPNRDSTPGPSSPYPVAIPTELPGSHI